MGGKEILLKAVIQSIPVFAMAVFKIPKKVCKDITDAMASFWWGGGGTRKSRGGCIGSHCGECVYPNGKGGNGFRDLHAFNLAMLAK